MITNTARCPGCHAVQYRQDYRKLETPYTAYVLLQCPLCMHIHYSYDGVQPMPPAEIKVGDVVQLKSGSPDMVVARVIDKPVREVMKGWLFCLHYGVGVQKFAQLCAPREALKLVEPCK